VKRLPAPIRPAAASAGPAPHAAGADLRRCFTGLPAWRLLLAWLLALAGQPLAGTGRGDTAADRAAAAEPTAIADLSTRAGEDWGTFLGPSGNGRSAATGIVRPWPAAGPRLVWHAAMGEGYCAPAVALGRCVVSDRVGAEIRTRCLEAETGREVWQRRYQTDYRDTFGYDGGPRAAAVIAGDVVVTFGPEGRLACLGLADGRLRWEVDTTAAYHVVRNFFGVGAAPVVCAAGNDRLVIVQVGGSRPGAAPPSPERLDLVKGLDSGLVAFDLATGRERWRATDELASYSTPVLARIDGAEVLLAWLRAKLVVVDPATGRVQADFRWRADELFSAIAASPVVAGSDVLLSETYGPGSVLLRFTRAGLEPLRRDPDRSRPTRSLRSHWATPVLADGQLYGSSGRNAGDAVLVCADWRSGEIRWSEPGLGRASVALVDGHLVVLGEFGELILARATPEKYDEVSRVRLVDPAAAGQARDSSLLVAPCWAAPIVARGYLFVRGQGRIVCLDLLAGT